MKLAFQFGLGAAFLLAIPSLVAAQHAPPIAGAAPPVLVHHVLPSPAPSHTRHLDGSGNSIPKSPANVNSNLDLSAFTPISGTGLGLQQFVDPFPQFGFNLNNLNESDRIFAIKALIDPVTQWQVALAERFLRETRPSAGFFFLDGGGSYVVPVNAEQQPQAQQPIIIVQQPAAPAAPPQTASNVEPAADPQAPLPDEGQFTLVLRNGTLIQAVAFTRVNDKIIYITPAGGRHTVALADLDTDTTQRVNQEQGIPLQIPL